MELAVGSVVSGLDCPSIGPLHFFVKKLRPYRGLGCSMLKGLDGMSRIEEINPHLKAVKQWSKL